MKNKDFIKKLAEILGQFRVERGYKHWYHESDNVDKEIEELINLIKNKK